MGEHWKENVSAKEFFKVEFKVEFLRVEDVNKGWGIREKNLT